MSFELSGYQDTLPQVKGKKPPTANVPGILLPDKKYDLIQTSGDYKLVVRPPGLTAEDAAHSFMAYWFVRIFSDTPNSAPVIPTTHPFVVYQRSPYSENFVVIEPAGNAQWLVPGTVSLPTYVLNKNTKEKIFLGSQVAFQME